MTTPIPLVELRGLGKHFGEGAMRVDALADVDLDVHAGEVVGLLGPSGSGKSTLLNLVGCILEPTAGTMRLDGEEVWNGVWKRKDLRRLRLEKIGFIFQFHNLLPFLNAWENIAIVRTLLGDPAAAARRRAFELLDYLKMSHRREAMPAQLSGGEAQRVAIARALANDSRIILADEPTAALDSERALAVIELLRTAALERQAAVLVVTHDDKIFGRLDKKVHLRDGRLDPNA
jgi:putative ABC transport system ATP-binding protein